jgi:glycosyltransferase involved in cell wall biosynthesis
LASKRQLVEILQIDESKVHVTPNSVASNYRPTRDENTITEYDITGSYVFHLSNASERKNPQGIIRGFEIARNQFGLDRKLVIAGGRWDESLVREHAKYDETLENVSVLGYTPETDLPVLYTHADGFLFPSLSEGFGIPLLESMSCGTPVLTTDAYAMPEVAGNAGVYVDDPNDYEQIADRLISLIDRRAVLSQRALKQAGEFSWDLTADRTLEVYRKITR